MPDEQFQMILLSRGLDRQVRVMHTTRGWCLYGDDVESRDLRDDEVVEVVRDWLAGRLESNVPC